MVDGSESVISGIGVVAGLAFAPARWVNRQRAEVDLTAHGAPDEPELAAAKERFSAAAQAVSARLAERAGEVTGVSSEVLGATAKLASDRGWIAEAGKHLAKGVSPEGAAVLATATFADLFAKLGGRQAERITDLEDVRDRVVAELTGAPEPGLGALSGECVLLAEDLAPADTAGLDPAWVRAVVTELGGPTSHTSIIARQLGIPCVVAASGLSAISEGEAVLVDGSQGTVVRGAKPDEAAPRAAADLAVRERAATWQGPAVTADGTPVQLLANVQDGASARTAAASPAEGIGLLRTELAFLTAKTEPTVAEQAALYQEVLSAFPGGKVVVRTLDAGSDKPVPFTNLPEEENPALGVRGFRLETRSPGLLDRQLDALAEAVARNSTGESNGPQTAEHSPWVMAPMIATVAEAQDFSARCRDRNLVPGIMVEVPAVALCIDQFLAEGGVEFLSIGTNDLTQYTMAADRMSPDLARLTDPWQPAVLRLIAQVTRAAGPAEVPVGVCGEAAADPLLACVLVGLGVSSLSAASAALPYVGAQLATVSSDQCQRAAEAVLSALSASEARTLAADILITD